MARAIFDPRSDFFSALDRHFALGLGRIAKETSTPVLFAAALASRQVREGHTCLDFSGIDPEIVSAEYPGRDGPPANAEWLAALRASPLVAEVAKQGDVVDVVDGSAGAAPLVLDSRGRLYLRRYFFHQRDLADALVGRASNRVADVDLDLLAEGLDRFFGTAPPFDGEPAGQGDLFAQSSPGHEPDLQRLAAATAVLRRFCVITGGPGTGKTSTVVKILALLIEQGQARSEPPPRILLLAPTGKAAATLAFAIRRAVETLACDDAIKDRIPRSASTIHRCLGVRMHGPSRFRHDEKNPLDADLVLVDEASMVDLALMTDLMAAIPHDARLILLGDEHQLASVEAGAVLGDICNSDRGRGLSRDLSSSLARVMGPSFDPGASAASEEAPALADSIARLVRSYRYDSGSGIGALAQAINRGDAQSALAILDDPERSDVSLSDPVSTGRMSDLFQSDIVAGFSGYLCEEDAAAQLERFSEYRVLCTHRGGSSGAPEINRICEAILRRAHKIRDPREHYPGRPIMVTRNDYGLELFNGDIGVLERPSDDDVVRALFLDAEGEQRHVPASRLPEYETAFAMTVHKSQGSEFDRVALIVSEHGAFQITRELIYTAVTRAKHAVTIFASRDSLVRAIGQRIDRASGLREALWGAE